jgi:hypothetical protein
MRTFCRPAAVLFFISTTLTERRSRQHPGGCAVRPVFSGLAAFDHIRSHCGDRMASTNPVWVPSSAHSAGRRRDLPIAGFICMIIRPCKMEVRE